MPRYFVTVIEKLISAAKVSVVVEASNVTDAERDVERMYLDGKIKAQQTYAPYRDDYTIEAVLDDSLR